MPASSRPSGPAPNAGGLVHLPSKPVPRAVLKMPIVRRPINHLRRRVDLHQRRPGPHGGSPAAWASRTTSRRPEREAHLTGRENPRQVAHVSASDGAEIRQQAPSRAQPAPPARVGHRRRGVDRANRRNGGRRPLPAASGGRVPPPAAARSCRFGCACGTPTTPPRPHSGPPRIARNSVASFQIRRAPTAPAIGTNWAFSRSRNRDRSITVMVSGSNPSDQPAAVPAGPSGPRSSRLSAPRGRPAGTPAGPARHNENP